MNISEEMKIYVWNYMVNLPKKERPNGCTDKRLQKAHKAVFASEFFWDDVVNRHGLNEDELLPELKEQEPEVYDHCVGNFWGMLMETMWRNGIIK